jgi:hypothetical protein
VKSLPVFAAAALLAACDLIPKLSPDASLTAARGSEPMAAPDCNSCHRYPLHDVNHNYHLMAANVNRNNIGQPELNAVTTCMDCHFNSIRHFGYVHADTTWVNLNGDTLVERTQPTDRVGGITRYPRWRPVPAGGADTSRGEALATEIDSSIFREALMGKMMEWMTGYAHNDGVVEVSFPPNDVTSRAALSTAFRPKDLSCSSITCHTAREEGYRWMDPSKGYSNCPSLTGLDSTCPNEVPPPGGI